MTPDQMSCLTQRCQYLGLRVEAKKRLGWDYTYDERERGALSEAILEITRAKIKRRAEPPSAEVGNGRHRAFSTEVREATKRRIARAEKG